MSHPRVFDDRKRETYLNFYLAVKEFLLLTRLFSIRAIDLNRDSLIEARPPIVPVRRMTIADSAFDYEQNLTYFYSESNQMIYSSKMDGESMLPIPVFISTNSFAI